MLAFRWLVILVAAILLSPTTAFAQDAKPRPKKRPNIVWITCEDMSPDLGCYGDKYARSPNLDKLAKQGARFTRAFSVAPVCAPSRSATITGMYPTTIGTHHMRSQGVPPDYVRCFTEYLRPRGYYCTNNVKTDYNFDSPLTAWDESSAKAHWRNRPNKDMPFFAVFNLVTTHESKYRAPDAEFFKLTKKLRPEDRHDPGKAVLPPYYPDTPLVRKDWSRYHDLITAMELQVAALLAELDEDGLAEDTIVFFFSDHGRGLPRAKRWPYDSGIYVPLIVRWPGQVPAGSTREDLVSFLDLAPTVIALAGGDPPGHMQGQVILGDREAPGRRFIYCVRDRMDERPDRIRAVRSRDYLYLRNFEPDRPYAQPIAYMDLMPTMIEWRRLAAAGQLDGPKAHFFTKDRPAEELYDVKADPHNVKNLAGSPAHKQALENMRKALDAWMKETGDLGAIPEKELREKARPGGIWKRTAAPVIQVKDGKAMVTCTMPGASIAYTTQEGAEARWLLYGGPIALPRSGTLRVRACRLGYVDSHEITLAP